MKIVNALNALRLLKRSKENWNNKSSKLKSSPSSFVISALLMSFNVSLNKFTGNNKDNTTASFDVTMVSLLLNLNSM